MKKVRQYMLKIIKKNKIQFICIVGILYGQVLFFQKHYGKIFALIYFMPILLRILFRINIINSQIIINF